MARLPRVVVVDVPHHVTQRGNARQSIFARDADRIIYLELLRQYSGLYGLGLLGYCLMSNHVHLIAVPNAVEAMARALQHTHGRYVCYWNARQCSTGHVWQGRFYSCPLDNSHLWEALRYTELNPSRAGMVTAAEQWKWSSVAAHCGSADAAAFLDMQLWRERGPPPSGAPISPPAGHRPAWRAAAAYLRGTASGRARLCLCPGKVQLAPAGPAKRRQAEEIFAGFSPV